MSLSVCPMTTLPQGSNLSTLSPVCLLVPLVDYYFFFKSKRQSWIVNNGITETMTTIIIKIIEIIESMGMIELKFKGLDNIFTDFVRSLRSGEYIFCITFIK